jgi:hypothetical protein
MYRWRKNELQESGAADKHQALYEVGNSASETLVLLTLAYDKYTLKKSRI